MAEAATARSGWIRRPAAAAGTALVCLVAVTFFPVPGFEFVGYDVRAQVVDNPAVREPTVENFKRVLTSRCITSYYPVRTLTYMVDCRLWGLRAGGFKLTNCLIHSANVLLLFWLALRLLRGARETRRRISTWWDVAAAGIAGGLLAVHPVVVEPVVWVAGREELLMTLGALGAIHMHIAARRLGEGGVAGPAAIACHAGAALCCAAACLSNAVAAVIPVLAAVWDVLYLPRPKLWRLLSGTAALWAIGAATIVVKRAGEVPGEVGGVDLSLADRLMLVANVYWLNLKTLLRPADLGFGYPLVTPAGFLDAGVLLGVAAVGLTLVVLWGVRRRKEVLFGLFWFLVAMGPSSQLVAHHIHRADRFLYLPLAGLALAVAMGWKSCEGRLRRPAAAVGAIALGVVALVALETLATRQVWTWRNEITACENSLRLDPTNPEARCALADRLVVHGQFRRAADTYREAMRLHPEDARIQSNFAWLLATCDDPDLRDPELAVELATRACRISQWKAPGFLQVLGQVYFRAAEEAARRGEPDRAARLYKKGVDEVLRLSLLLQADFKKRGRDSDEAVRLAEHACRLIERPEPGHLGALAEVYANAGKLDEAVRTMEKAVDACRAEGDPAQVDEFERRLDGYRSAVSGRASDE